MNLHLNEMELNDIGSWPLIAKGILIFTVTIGIIFVGIWLDTKKQMRILEQHEQEEVSLKKTFEYRQHQAANLEVYQEQLQTMKASFGALLRQLPDKTEVPGLLEDISQQGLASGLEFRTIRLLPEKEIDFYVELPIEIAVIGTYHQFAEFVSNIASLPRIVTLHDFVIRNLPSADTQERLMMNITAKTYRYTAEGEQLDE